MTDDNHTVQDLYHESVSATQVSEGRTGSERPLILYAYFETELARTNLEFFIAHGLHSAADFIFILNGDTDAHTLIPKEPNISYVKRENRCFDLGAFAEVLTKDNMYKGYKKFIMMNASLRGPFLPTWSEACWSDAYLNKVTHEVKVYMIYSPPVLLSFLLKYLTAALISWLA